MVEEDAVGSQDRRADDPSLVALIPARAGSKRVANKNVRPLADHPLIAYTIASSLRSGLFDSVMVSTDSEEIAEIAGHYGAEVPFLRPDEYATDTSPDIEWLEHMLGRLREQGREWSCFALLRPTSPFRTAGTLERAWTAFRREQGVDSLRAVEKTPVHPGKMWLVEGAQMRPAFTEIGDVRSPADPPWHSTPYQALPVVHAQNASLEIAWTEVVLEGGTIAGEVVMPFLTRGHEGFDINTEIDWAVAEELLRRGDAELPEVDRRPWHPQESE